MSWQSFRLGDLYLIGSSKRVLKSDWQAEGVPFYRGREITQLSINGYVDNELYITEKHYSDLIRKYGAPNEGDIMITAIGTIGNAYVVRKNDRFYFKDASVLWLKRTSEINSQFVNLWLQSLHFFEQLESGNGATVDTLSIQKLQSVKINVPPIQEQQRIVAILDQAFDGIGKARANAEQNLQNARALFESHLKSVFTQHGEEWVDATIGDCIKFIDYRGKTPVKTENGTPLITAKNVKMGYIQEEPREYVSPDIYDKWMTRGIPLKGDVLFTTEAPLANVAQLNTDDKVVFAQRIIIMQPDKVKLDQRFLKFMLMSAPIQSRIHEKATGATAQGIKASLLKTIKISFPNSISHQIKIAQQLETLDKETQRLEALYQRKIACLDELKKSLLQQAFAGEL